MFLFGLFMLVSFVGWFELVLMMFCFVVAGFACCLLPCGDVWILFGLLVLLTSV